MSVVLSLQYGIETGMETSEPVFTHISFFFFYPSPSFLTLTKRIRIR